MSSEFVVKTGRLELVAASLGLISAEIHDRGEFARLLEVAQPPVWPPQLNDADSMNYYLNFLRATPDGVGWGLWYVILPREAKGPRVLAGVCGFKGLPGEDGTVEIGYSLLEEFHGGGLGSEAAGALIEWAMSHPSVTRIIAETFPELIASIRVLEKNGFAFIGPGSEPGTIQFELRKKPAG